MLDHIAERVKPVEIVLPENWFFCNYRVAGGALTTGLRLNAQQLKPSSVSSSSVASRQTIAHELQNANLGNRPSERALEPIFLAGAGGLALTPEHKELVIAGTAAEVAAMERDKTAAENRLRL